MIEIPAPLYALTLYKPWPYAIFHLPAERAKRIENRTWKPPASIVGKRVAIHAGKRMDMAAFDVPPIADALARSSQHERNLALQGGIIGTAVVAGWVDTSPNVTAAEMFGGRLTDEDAAMAMLTGWFSGPIGWVLDEVSALTSPVECSGAQGLWVVPPDVRAQVIVRTRRPDESAIEAPHAKR